MALVWSVKHDFNEERILNTCTERYLVLQLALIVVQKESDTAKSLALVGDTAVLGKASGMGRSDYL